MIYKNGKFQDVVERIDLLIEGETDIISKMSTISCEIFQSFGHFNWVGFYRLVDNQMLKVGPYQGTHGCLTIKVGEGVCGRCALEKKVQLENDVNRNPHHIACSADTKSEIVIPVFDKLGTLKAVLDIDSIELNSFNSDDSKFLTHITSKIY